MISYLLRKIALNPGASALIIGLAVFIVVSEIGGINPSPEQITITKTVVMEPSENSQTSKELQPHQIALAVDDSVKVEQLLEQKTRESIEQFDPQLANLLSNKQFGQLRERLLKLASVAVGADDKNRLGYILNLLGQISIQEQDTFSAQVYLDEALDIFNDLNDEMGAAQVKLQLGRTHLKTRQIARVAGTAYDELQIGRWYLAHGIHDIAEKYILNSIQKNLSINRYGSAASAYESLAKLYTQINDTEKTRAAVFKSARQYSASGKTSQAKSILTLLPYSESQQSELAQLNRDIESNYQDYQNSILQIERARDYRRLYHLYRSQGDEKRAWNFRMLANDSLSQVSKRALFHRQQGVLAILYNSNESMDKAEDYFTQARQTFDVHGLLELADETEILNQQVY